MGQIKTFKDLLVWQKSMNLVTNIYILTQQFPSTELFGLSNQLRRAAVSIPSNIAEGYGRRSSGDYRRFLQMALASLYELQTQLEIGLNIGLVTRSDFTNITGNANEIERMMCSLINKVR